MAGVAGLDSRVRALRRISRWSFGVRALVIAQAARPSWPFLEGTYTRKWVKRLPDDAPLQVAAPAYRRRLRQSSGARWRGVTRR